MKRLWFLFCLMVLFLSCASSKCSEGQIDINSASVEELDKITYIGPATASKIIAARPFDSLEDLMNVSGIGQTKLNAIQEEGLACVEDFDEEEEEEVKKEVKIEPKEIPVEEIEYVDAIPQEVKELEVIKLNSKDIKDNNSIQENKKGSMSTRYAGFGLAALSVLLLILLFFQRKNGIE